MTPTIGMDRPTAAPAKKPRKVKPPIRRTFGAMVGFLGLGVAALAAVLALAAGIYIFQDAYKVRPPGHANGSRRLLS